MNSTLRSLQPGDSLLVPNKTFHVMGGIRVANISHVVIRIDGTLRFAFENTFKDAEAYIKQWPRRSNGKDVLECLEFQNITNVTFTSRSGFPRLAQASPRLAVIASTARGTRMLDHSKPTANLERGLRRIQPSRPACL